MHFLPDRSSIVAFLKDRSTTTAMIADVYAIAGVLFMDWNPYRIMGFYWLENCVAFYFLMATYFYHVRDEPRAYTIISGFVSTVFIAAIMMIYLMAILTFPKEINPRAPAFTVDQIFYPYYDIAFFLVLTIISHFFRYRKLSFYDRNETNYYRMTSFVVGLVVIPAIFLTGAVLSRIIGNLKLCVIVSMVIYRNCIEYWRYSSLRKLLSVLKLKSDTAVS
jgi:hypothetical protein